MEPDINDPKFSEWREEQIEDYYLDIIMDSEKPSKSRKVSEKDTPGESCYKSSLRKLVEFVTDYKFLSGIGVGFAKRLYH